MAPPVASACWRLPRVLGGPAHDRPTSAGPYMVLPDKGRPGPDFRAARTFSVSSQRGHGGAASTATERHHRVVATDPGVLAVDGHGLPRRPDLTPDLAGSRPEATVFCLRPTPALKQRQKTKGQGDPEVSLSWPDKHRSCHDATVFTEFTYTKNQFFRCFVFVKS